jgi:ketosteroid isomerase-like protein
MRFLPLAALLGLGACSGDAPPPDLASHKEEIRRVLREYHDAGDKGDVARMVSFLAPECTMFKGQEDFARRAEECEKELTERIKKIEGQNRSTLLGRETIEVTGNIAVVTYVASVNVGNLRAPITAVFRRSGDKWLIAHLHESWPVPAPPPPPPPPK